jgi:hypothetical protein
MRKKQFKPVSMLILFLLIVLSAPVIRQSDVYAGKGGKKKLYITNIKGDDTPRAIVDRVKRGISVSILENYGDMYQILDDDAVKVMFAQVAKLQSMGCNEESCISQIADGINADEIIYGDVIMQAGKITVEMKSLEKKDMEYGTKSIVILTFNESQTDWFSGEIAKKLINPKYKIDAAKAPADFDKRVDLKTIETGTIEGVHIKEVKGFNIEVLKFQSTDEEINNIMSYLKELVQQGDGRFQASDFEGALGIYFQIIDKINDKLRPESRERIKAFSDEIIKRIDITYRMYYKRDIENADAFFQQGKYYDSRLKYSGILERINRMPSGFRDRIDITAEVRKRIESAYVMEYKLLELGVFLGIATPQVSRFYRCLF